MGIPPSAIKDLVGLAPAESSDPVVEAYKKDVDRTLLRRNLRLSPRERGEQLVKFLAAIRELRAAEERLRKARP